MMQKRARIEGGILGLLVGDAMGVPYEFHLPHKIPAYDLVEMTPPLNFPRTYPYIKPGTWSDDGAQALCLLDSLISKGVFDLNDFSSKLLAWYETGLWAVDRDVFDIGGQTGASLLAFRSGVAPTVSGQVRPDGKGNGALMRVLPLALWHRGEDEQLVADAHEQCLVTHGHPLNQVCCAIYCLWARYLLVGQEESDAFDRAIRTLRAIYPRDSIFAKELEQSVRPEEDGLCTGSGYVVDSLKSAKRALQQGNYERVVKFSISLGHDTDTTAAIAGGLAGVRDGIQGIPPRWINALRGKAEMDPLLNRLLERMGGDVL